MNEQTPTAADSRKLAIASLRSPEDHHLASVSLTLNALVALALVGALLTSPQQLGAVLQGYFVAALLYLVIWPRSVNCWSVAGLGLAVVAYFSTPFALKATTWLWLVLPVAPAVAGFALISGMLFQRHRRLIGRSKGAT